MPDGTCQLHLSLVIPAYQPEPQLYRIIEELSGSKVFDSIVVVNDGSHTRYESDFEKIRKIPNTHVLTHAINQGKGEALKTAFNYVLTELKTSQGVVTADADGQHSCEDILKVARMLCQERDSLILGVRSFPKDIPLRSRIGNLVTRRVFSFFIGQTISDTQTGLRGIPRQFLYGLLTIKSERYEFELDVLIKACEEHITIREVPIATVYIDNNRGSHFDPIFDSMRIYFVFFRFIFSSLLTAGLDTLVFFGIHQLTNNVLFSISMGRIVAGTFNFLVVKKVVFHSRGRLISEAARYFLLVLALMAISYTLLTSLVHVFHFDVLSAKIFAETLLFLFSFAAQRVLIFNRDSIQSSGKTDWNTYYHRSSITASYTRTVKARKLLRLVEKFGDKKTGPTLIELGGANSCFYRHLQNKIKPDHYTIIDSNTTGLEKFRENNPDTANVSLVCDDVLNSKLVLQKADLCFSVGLIEHFNEEGTKQAIGAHFRMTKPGGLVIMAFPTPTWLYRTSRFASQILGLWIFHDERPLCLDEVIHEAEKFGRVIHHSIDWTGFLTQATIVTKCHQGP